ncbi:SELENOI isoform 3, partial [Pan troglodytes]
MAGYEYVSPEQLAGFDKYKYSAVDTNPLSLYVMHPFWNTIVKVFPTWLAPNLITFSGFLLVVFNFLLMAYFDPDFYASAPGHKHVPDWVWIVVGILNFVAYTLGCALCVTLPMSLLNFFRSYKNNTLKLNSVYEAMVPLFSPCLLFILSTAWILWSPSDILELHPRVFYFMVGTAFANST